jgi:hypothetical protein
MDQTKTWVRIGFPARDPCSAPTTERLLHGLRRDRLRAQRRGAQYKLSIEHGGGEATVSTPSLKLKMDASDFFLCRIASYVQGFQEIQ